MKSPEEIAREIWSEFELYFTRRYNEPMRISKTEYQHNLTKSIAKAIQRERDRPATAQAEDGSLVCLNCDELRSEVERLKQDYERACQTIAEMHRAAVGEVTGPKKGVVEDVAELRSALKEAVEMLDKGEPRWKIRAKLKKVVEGK